MTNQSYNGGRRAHGEAKNAVSDYIDQMPAGKEFWYGEVAEELGISLPSVSGIMRRLRDEDNSPVKSGRIAGHYVRVAQAVNQAGAAGMGKGDLLEVVAVFKDGRLLLSSADGKVWEAAQV
jgi:hypothetical protein